MFLRKTASVFVILIFLFNIMGYYVAFELIQFRVKGEMQEQLESDNIKNLQLLVFSKTSSVEKIKWKNSNEFIYKGQLYDVKSTSEKGDSLIILCIHDHHEDHLYEGLRQMDPAGKKFLASVYSQIVQIGMPEKQPVSMINTSLACLLPDPSVPAELDGPSDPGNPPPKRFA